MKKELLFSLSKKDFTIQVFRAGGKGGQKQNKTSSGVRIIHNESGARGECRNHREQSMNKKIAMQRLSNSTHFRIWINRKAQEVIEGIRLEEKVEKMMDEKNLKFETKDEDGRWVEVDEIGKAK
jgi:protein subunit release factor B